MNDISDWDHYEKDRDTVGEDDTIYVLCYIDWEEHRILGVFSTKDKVMELERRLFPRLGSSASLLIEEYVLDTTDAEEVAALSL